MTKPSDREILLTQLESFKYYDDAEDRYITDWSKIVDFILTDRRRICEALIKYKFRSVNKGWGMMESDKLIDKTINLAGLKDARPIRKSRKSNE